MEAPPFYISRDRHAVDLYEFQGHGWQWGIVGLFHHAPVGRSSSELMLVA